MVWGVGLSCDLQVAGLISVATRSRDPPYHRDFDERDMIICIAVTNGFTNIRGYGRKLAEKLTRPIPPIIINIIIMH